MNGPRDWLTGSRRPRYPSTCVILIVPESEIKFAKQLVLVCNFKLGGFHNRVRVLKNPRFTIRTRTSCFANLIQILSI